MVTRSALRNAASIAQNILTSEAIVAEPPERDHGHGGGMPDMSEMRRVVPRDATIHAEHDRVLWLLRDAGGHSLSTAAMRDAAFVGRRP